MKKVYYRIARQYFDQVPIEFFGNESVSGEALAKEYAEKILGLEGLIIPDE